MLQVVVPARELFDDRTQTFLSVKETKLNLEHSLISLSKWESKWHKPFLTEDDKTVEEVKDYIRCMTINQNVDPKVYDVIPTSVINDIDNYIHNSMTATWFNDPNNKTRSKQIITSEVVYGWMVAFNIPFECEKWHLNRLITLIRVCEINNSSKKKMPMKKVIEDQRSLNEKRKKQMNTKG